jgi:hypothetical protein
VAVSSRSTYAGGDTSGVTTLLGRITGAVPLAADYTPTRAAKLDNLDATVSSRNATTPPTAAANASAVRTELTTELGRIDAAISSRATQTSVDNIAIAGTASLYAPTSATRTIGSDQGGTYASLASHDEVYFATGEVSGTGLDVTVIRGTSMTTENPSLVRVSGYYQGSTGHNMDVLVWNFITSAWESKGTLLTRTSSFDYTFPLSIDNHSASTGEMRIRFLHNTTTYIASHRLYLDFVSFEKVATSNQLGSDVAAIKAKTDAMKTFADVSSNSETYGKQFRDMLSINTGITGGGLTTVETFMEPDGVTPRVVSTNDGTNRTNVSRPGV